MECKDITSGPLEADFWPGGVGAREPRSGRGRQLKFMRSRRQHKESHYSVH